MKAKTDLKVVCDAREIVFFKPGEVIVPVYAFDRGGTNSFSAEIKMNVKCS